MKLLMAVSKDGFLASGPDDKMQWTGVTDKAIFRLLTLSSHHNIFAGRVTAERMPTLPGRTVMPLSREGMTLLDAAAFDPKGWLIGGPTVALEALKLKLVTLAIICRVQATLYNGVSFHEIASRLSEAPAHTIRFEEVKVMLFTPHAGEG